MSYGRLHLFSILLLALSTIQGCSTMPNERLWGQDATLTPGWERVRDSAIDSVRDPWVWAPLVAAGVFQIDNWDHRTANWARTHTPLFGSQRNAEQWSDDLQQASAWAHYATVLATPDGDDFGEWLLAKGKGFLVQSAAVSITANITSRSKELSNRERPNGLGNDSFPSGHTSSAAVHTRLARENLQLIMMNNDLRRGLDIGLDALTIGTSWARIEAGGHYPSDTLVGMALGHFVATFINNTFLGLDRRTAAVAFATTPGGAMLEWRWSF